MNPVDVVAMKSREGHALSHGQIWAEHGLPVEQQPLVQPTMRTPQKRVPNGFEGLTVFQHHRLQRAADERKAGVGLTQLQAENASHAFDGMTGVDVDGVSVDGD